MLLLSYILRSGIHSLQGAVIPALSMVIMAQRLGRTGEMITAESLKMPKDRIRPTQPIDKPPLTRNV